MLGKLIKYEWKSVYKVCTIALGVVLGVSLVGVIFFNTPFWSGLFDWSGDLYSSNYNDLRGALTLLAGMFTMILYVCALIGGMYGLYIYLLVHFYRSMYTDEGYLTHTLPVNSHHLLLSKVLVGGLWALIMEIVIVLSMFMVLYSFVNGLLGPYGGMGAAPGEFFEALGELVSESGNPFIVILSLIVALLSALVSPFASMCMYFCGLSLGQLSRSHKGLVGILACFVVVFVNMLLSFFVEILLSGVFGTMISAPNMGTLLLTVGMGVGCYFLTHYLMTSKLNLE